MGSRRRFLVAALPVSVPAEVTLSPELAHYALHVLRLTSGAEVELFDGQRRLARGRLGAGALVELYSLQAVADAGAEIVLAAALIKGDRQDWLVEKATELGVARLVPLQCERSVVRALGDEKRQRYQRLIEAATRQSGRADLMKLAPLTSLGELELGGAIVLDLLAGATLHDVAKDTLECHHRVTLIVGPEGGFSEAERERLISGGAVPAFLGASTLRAETAALAAVSVAVAARMELSSSAS